MKKTNILRVIIYLAVMAIFIVYIQIEKQKVIDARNKEAITLIGENLEHGIPVDLQEIHPKPLAKTLRVTVTKVNKKNKTLNFYFDRSQKGLLKKSQPVLDADDSKSIGEIKSLARNISSSLGLYKGTIKLSDDQNIGDLTLKSLDIVIGKSKNTLSVPQTAIQYSEKGEPYVWLDEEGKTKKQIITVGKSYSLESEVTQGLKEGMRVVINGGKTLDADSLLRVRNCKDCEGVVKND